MASFTFNRGANSINDGSVDLLTGTIKVMLVTVVPNQDDDNLSAFTELNVGGYAPGFAGAGRKTLASKTVTVDDTLNRSAFDAADPSAWTLAVGGTVVGAVAYDHLTSDALSTPLFFLDTGSIPTNGSTFTLQFHADGIGYTQQ
jgi:hypothetical protein